MLMVFLWLCMWKLKVKVENIFLIFFILIFKLEFVIEFGFYLLGYDFC